MKKTSSDKSLANTSIQRHAKTRCQLWACLYVAYRNKKLDTGNSVISVQTWGVKSVSIYSHSRLQRSLSWRNGRPEDRLVCGGRSSPVPTSCWSSHSTSDTIAIITISGLCLRAASLIYLVFGTSLSFTFRCICLLCWMIIVLDGMYSLQTLHVLSAVKSLTVGHQTS